MISRAGAKEIILDLSGMTFVDREGETLLTSILKCGPNICARGVIRHIGEHAEKGILKN